MDSRSDYTHCGAAYGVQENTGFFCPTGLLLLNTGTESGWPAHQEPCSLEKCHWTPP